MGHDLDDDELKATRKRLQKNEENMEEDIKILEKLIKEFDEFEKRQHINIYIYMLTKREKQAIEHLIARYKKSEDKNKTLETLLQGNLYQIYLYYKELAGRYQANSISKDKVREKIEELKTYGNNLTDEERQNETEFLQGKLKAYEELLED